jgi:hypothetical protein
VNDLHDDPEAIAALAVLDGLGRLDSPDETSVPAPGDEVEEVLRRLHAETIALLPYALDLVAPPAGLRGRLLTTVVGDATQEVTHLQALPEAVAPPPPSPTFAAHGRAAMARRRRGGAWLAAAAAVLAIAGLGLWAAYLQSELAASRARLAWAEREWKAEAELQRASLQQLEESWQQVTAAAVTIFPLRCPTGRGPAANARVYVYLPPDRSQWALAAHGLAPEPPGREYQLWFLVGDRPQSAGCFHMEAGRAVVAMPEKPPAGITGLAVTVEPKGGSPRPTGDMILVAQQPVRL